jgi:transcriptional regulator with XRE-family HTH domain
MNEQQQRWRLVGEAIRRRYKQDLHIDQAELVRRAGVSDPIIRAMESGDVGPKGPRHTTIYKVERALGWAEGSIDQILDGGEPTLLEEVSSPDAATSLETTVERLGQMLAALDVRLDQAVARDVERTQRAESELTELTQLVERERLQLTRRAETEHRLLADGLAELRDRVGRIELRLGE